VSGGRSRSRATRPSAAARPSEDRLLWTVALGILVSVVGGVIANLIGSGDVFELNVIGFIVAVIASVACWQPPNAQAWPRASHADASNAEAAMPEMSTCRAAEAGQTCRGTGQH